MIVFCLRFSQENGGLLKLANLSTKVRMIFEITRAYRVFDIFDDLGTAVKSFAV